jgi:threonine dehydrogenase-like Zn-dependent dehydrogenase
VIATDVSEFRREIATQVGADRTVDAMGDVVAEVLAWTKGEGVDVVIEAVGGNQLHTLRQATQIARPGGIVVVVGTFSEETPVRLQDLRMKEVAVLGSRGQYQTYAPCLELVSSRKVDVRPMITHRFSLDSLEIELQRMPDKSARFFKKLVCF